MDEEFYKVTWSGVYLGATAIVAAENEQDAINLVKAHISDRSQIPLSIEGIKVERLSYAGPGVLYFDDGDY